ncbi:MAG: hypothetical protein WBN06_08130 [Lysobacterales bacterium]
MPSLIPEDLSAPGTHALVIGVSAYRHFDDGIDPTPNGIETGMEQLTAAARSASEFAAWLLQEYSRDTAPLKSLRVLLSPSDGEEVQPDIAALLGDDSAATIANVKAELAGFKAAADTHLDNTLVVYVAGHGVQLTKNGAIVLLNDFGAAAHLNKLEGAIDMAGVHAGMNHPNTAKTQFWFVDSCRQKPLIARRFESLEGALKLSVPVGDTEASPLFLAATTGKEAFAFVDGVTVFNKALMWALKGGVATGPEDNGIDKWHIPVTNLIKSLPEKVKSLALAESADQSVDIAGKIHEAIFHQFPDAPQVDLSIDLIPSEAKTSCTGTLKRDATIPVIEDFADWPMHEKLDAGLYLLNVKAEAPFTNRDQILQLVPPEKSTEVSVET